MDIQDILAIIGAATGVAQELAAGTTAEHSVEIVAALEDIVAKALKFHVEHVGEPMDLTKFHHQDPIL